MNENVLYLIAALRDGSIDSRNGKNYEIKIGQKDQRWLSDIIKPIIESNFGVRVNIHKNLLRLTNKKAVQEIQRISGIKSFGWNTPETVKKLPLEKRIPYIRGFWDAEGGLPKKPETCDRSEQTYISFHQKQKEPLIFIRNSLIKMGFKPTKITKCSNAHEFRITRKEHMKRFYNKIGSWHPEKSKRMTRLIKNIS
jgi:intein-encoded DNA endonuclease-like protein